MHVVDTSKLKSRSKTYWCWGGTSSNSWKGGNEYIKERRNACCWFATSLCKAGQEVVAEATIRVMYDISNDEHSEAVLLVDAENALNSINRHVSSTIFL